MSASSPPKKMQRLDDKGSSSAIGPAASSSTAAGSSAAATSATQPGGGPPSSSGGIKLPGAGRRRIGLSSVASTSAPKKLVVKERQPSSSSDKSKLTQAQWIQQAGTTLARAARAILSRESPPDALETLYSTCDDLVRLNDIDAGSSRACANLYDRIRLELERAVGQLRSKLSDRDLLATDTMTTTAAAAATWLTTLENEWNAVERDILLLRGVLLQLDRGFVLRSPDLLPIWDLGQDILRHSFVDHDAIAHRLSSSLLSLIKCDRDEETAPMSLVHAVALHLHSLSTQSHLERFVTPFLSDTRSYYAAVAARHSPLSASPEALVAQAKGDTSASTAYLALVERTLEREGALCDNVVGATLKGSVVRIVLDEMVVEHVDAIAETDTGALVEQDRLADLASVYRLLGRVDRRDVLRDAFHEHVKARGLATVMDATKDDVMIPTLIALRKRAAHVVQRAFADDPGFALAVMRAFEHVVNKRENKPAEMIAKFLDARLRSGNKGMDDAELERSLDDVLAMFKYTQGKDIFEAFYKRDLARRLLLNKSASSDAERSMLLRLKDECGAGFTHKLEIMFKDIELSADIMHAYRDATANNNNDDDNGDNGGGGIDLSVNVLSMGNWPTYAPSKVRVPADMARALERFRAFYVGKHAGRALTWQHSLDSCTLRVHGLGRSPGRRELLVSLYQAVVLLLFNGTHARLSFRDIVAATELDEREAKRTLQSLACGKVRVLVKHPRGREVETTDEFALNESLKLEHVRVKVNEIQHKETAEENTATTQRVLTDRGSHIQLALVRIMKARKTVRFAELTMLVAEQVTRFRCEPHEIKKAISSLIEREYMRRADDQPNVFHYVA